MKKSAGILVFRFREGLEVLLAHPGGPFYTHCDKGYWGIPKGEDKDGDLLETAKREFFEETSFHVEGDFISLGENKQSSRKTVYIWGQEGDFDPGEAKSNLFPLEWPPKSGIIQEFPEVDRVEWFPIEKAMTWIHDKQRIFLERLVKRLK